MGAPRWWLLLGAMACRSPGVVAPAGVVDSAAAWSAEAAIGVLRAGSEHPDPSIRAAAVASWIGSSHESSLELAPWVLADPSAHVQRRAARAAAGRSIVLTVHPSSDELALAVLGSLPNEAEWTRAAIASVADGMEPPDPAMLEYLVTTGEPSLGPALMDGLAAADELAELPLAIAAIAVEAEGAASSLTSLLSGANEATRIAAIEGLLDASGERARPWLERAAKRPGSDAALHARLGLVALGARPVSIGLEALGSPDRDTRAWAVRCVGMAGAERPLPREAIARLQSSLRDEAPRVQAAAVDALMASAGVEYVPLAPQRFAGEPDAVSAVIAGKWLESQSGGVER